MYVNYRSEFASFDRPKCATQEAWLDCLMTIGWLRGRRDPKRFNKYFRGKRLIGEELAVYQAGWLRGKHGNSLDGTLIARKSNEKDLLKR